MLCTANRRQVSTPWSVCFYELQCFGQKPLLSVFSCGVADSVLDFRIHAINAITHTMIIASLPYHPPHHPYDDYRKLTVKWQLMCMDTACVELGAVF